MSPLVKLGWQVNDYLEIQTDGLGLEVAGKPRKDLTLFAVGGLRDQSWRLENRGGQVGRGVLRHRKIPLIAGVQWRPSKHWRLRAEAGALLYQKYRVRDDDGNNPGGKNRDDSTNEPAFTGRIKLQYRF